MQKNTRPAHGKSGVTPEDLDDAITQSLCDLAIDLVEQEDSASLHDALIQKESDFHKIIKKCLNQKKDDILYESLERAKYADSNAYQHLKEAIEDTSGTINFTHRDGQNIEVNAFLIPLFIWSTGGLDSRLCFQDQAAFESLRKSFKEAHLESQDATVALVNHAYHLDEIDSIAYSHLNQMVRDAFATMTDKKMAATPALERSIVGWPENHFGINDVAVELRFLLGFSMKRKDDPFYQVPEDPQAADDYFEKRTARFQVWSEQIAPIIKRCLVTNDADIDVKFLYQDLFHGGKERGMAEYFMLQMMSELNRALDERGTQPEKTKAIVGPADVAGKMMLRVNLYAEADNALLASADKPCGVTDDLQVEFDDAFDALMTMGVPSLSIAMKFDVSGQPVDVRPYAV